MRSIDFARTELEAIGAFDPDKDFYGGHTGKAVMELIELFAKQKHSGMSSSLVAGMFRKLTKWEPLSPIMNTEDEWSNDISGDETYQNKRCPAVFKQGKDGKPYYIDAIVWEYEDGGAFTGTVEDITSRQFCKIPFSPKSFYVKISKEDEQGSRVILDKETLNKAFKYYQKQEQ